MTGQQKSTEGLAIHLQKRAELDRMLAERLKKSILQEAIEGRLVPQDPNDEPASVLLDKIRKEKAKLVKEGNLKRKTSKRLLSPRMRFHLRFLRVGRQPESMIA